MERFKACEKEMKTKAFSREGLNAAAKLDPKEQLKFELCQWITTMVDELSRQIEQSEAEIESLQLAKKKKDSEKEARLDELETMNERRGWHVGRLELILRLLENGNLQVDAVAEAKDDIAYFVESNTVSHSSPLPSLVVLTRSIYTQEEDFEEDEGIYDELNLQEEEDIYGLNKDDDIESHDSVSVAEETPSIPPTPSTTAPALFSPPPRTPAKEAPVEKSPAQVKVPTKPSPTATRKMTLDSTTAPRPNFIAANTTPSRTNASNATIELGVPTPRTAPVPTVLPPIRYAAAAAAANAPLPPPASLPPPAVVAAPVSAPPPGLPLPPSISAPASVSTTADSRVTSSVSSPELAKNVLPTSQPGVGMSLVSPAMSAASLNVRLPSLRQFVDESNFRRIRAFEILVLILMSNDREVTRMGLHRSRRLWRRYLLTRNNSNNSNHRLHPRCPLNTNNNSSPLNSSSNNNNCRSSSNHNSSSSNNSNNSNNRNRQLLSVARKDLLERRLAHRANRGYQVVSPISLPASNLRNRNVRFSPSLSSSSLGVGADAVGE